MNSKRHEDFHAGRFLQDSLQRSGFGIAWLADKTGYDVTKLEQLLSQPNIDAELFVNIGRPMGAAFFGALDVTIFGRKPTEAQGMAAQRLRGDTSPAP